MPSVQPVYESPVVNKINGLGFGVVNESQLSFRPFSGGETGGTFEGLDSVIQPLVTQLTNNNYSVEYKRSKSPFSTVTFKAAWSSATAGGEASNPNLDYVDTWELIRNTVQKEILESDHPLVAQLGAGNFQILKNLFTNSGTDKFTGNETTFNNNPSADYSAAIYLWALFQSGVKTVPVKQPVLRLTRTTNPLYDAPFNVSNVDTILTTASMLADSGVPSNFAIPLITLSDTLTAKAGDMVARAAAAGITLAFGWYKDLNGSNKHGSKRIQYTLEYQFGIWDTMLNGTPS